MGGDEGKKKKRRRGEEGRKKEEGGKHGEWEVREQTTRKEGKKEEVESGGVKALILPSLTFPGLELSFEFSLLLFLFKISA